jgi:hypothetical protein
MYDTVGAMIPVGPGIAESACWQFTKTSDNRATGERRVRQHFNEPGRPQLTLCDGLTLQVERSLPKALLGSNARDLEQGELAAALATVDRELEQLLRVELPPVRTWQPFRADYCENEQLEDELAVRRTIHQAREVVLARKGRPVVGQSGTSLAWPSRSIGLKIYGKHAESGEAGTEGLLRRESTVRHLGTFRRLLELERGVPIQLADVLTPATRRAVFSRFDDLKERFLMTETEMTDRRFVEAFLECFPTTRVATLTGFCILYTLAGSPTAASIARGDRSVFGYSRESVYRYLADLRKFRLHLVEKGFIHARLDVANNRQEHGLDELREVIERVAGLVSHLPSTARVA